MSRHHEFEEGLALATEAEPSGLSQTAGACVLGRLTAQVEADPWRLLAHDAASTAEYDESDGPVACFRTVIPTGDQQYLLDHQVRGRSILPAAGYVSLMVATARAAGLVPVHGELCLAEVGFFRPLNLTRGQIQVQTSLTPDPNHDAAWRVAVHARALGAERWNLYATAQLRPAGRPSSVRLYENAGDEREEPVASYYDWWFQLGLEYGRCFRALTRLVHSGVHAKADLRLASDLADWPADAVHPVVLDGAFQTLGVLLAATGSDRSPLPLPVAIESFTLRRPFQRAGVVECALRPTSDSGRREVDLNVYDAAGGLVAEIRGLRLRGGAEDAGMAKVRHRMRGVPSSGVEPPDAEVQVAGESHPSEIG